MRKSIKLIALFCLILLPFGAYAQNALTATLMDSSNGDPVGFATVSLTLQGAKKPAKYVLSNEEGLVKMDGVRAGKYVLKAELLGYKTLEVNVTVPEKTALGVLKMNPDQQQLEAAKVSAMGNAILIKKDTVEYNASSFKTTDNDVLEDLLKKLPGVEVSEDGSISVNGQTISKITIDGKTFFLDDPQLASKNIPAKIINKLKVIQKKSDQAAFTGIDDGEEEQVIDLSIKPGMMKGAFGNIMAGAGHDIPASEGVEGDWRYQGAAFVGKFTDKTQLSLLLNANNTNNRGFNDLAGNMMGNMRGGGGGRGRGQGGWGGGNGITTSYMGGVNGAWDLFEDKMDLGANYLYNHTSKDVEERAVKTVYGKGSNDDMVYTTSGPGNDGGALNSTRSDGHRFGVRLEHKFSDNTSIIFEPQLNFGTGSYAEMGTDETFRGTLGGTKVNKATTNNSGVNDNVSTSGFFLFRQRLGIPGRTLTAMTRYSYSHNNLDGIINTNTEYYDGLTPDDEVNQTFNRVANSASIMGRVTYTEPLGHNLYVEGNYRYSWSKSDSEKETFDVLSQAMDYEYSNKITNIHRNQSIGANLMYQKDKMRAQIGFSAQPTSTYNSTTKYDAVSNTYSPKEYTSNQWNFAPQAMLWWDINDTANARLFYRGRSSEPSVNQLMPVPDNTDPLNISFGNPRLTPYFGHGLFADYKFNNKKSFLSFNMHFEGNYVQNPIVSMLWTGANGAQFTMPFNGPDKGDFNFNCFLNAPIGKSNFSFTNVLRGNFSKSSSYVGTNINMDTYYDPNKGFYDFMEELSSNFNDPAYAAGHVTLNTTTTWGFMERIRLTYRVDNLELQASGRTRMSHSSYSISPDKDLTTWNNQLRMSCNWTWENPGITFKSQFNYNWYAGYDASLNYTPEYVMDAEIQKLLFKKKVTIALKGYDIFGQAKNLTVSDTSNYHSEAVNNTLGRYIILSLTYRFGTFDRSKMKGGPGMGRGPMR